MPSELARRLHPSSLLFSVGSVARGMLVPGILVLYASRGSNAETWFMLLVGLAVAGAAVAKYLSYRYRLGEDELIVREGIVTRNERHIPYSRIQNIDLVQNPLHRIFGVAEVRVETASGDKPEAVMRVLALGAIEQMRARVFAWKHRADSQTVPADSEAEPLHDMPSREVFLFGVISNKGMVVVAAAIGAMSQFDPIERLARSVPVESMRRETVGALQFRPWEHPARAVLLVALLLALSFVLLRVLSISWAFFKFHGFRLQRLGEDLRYRHGLLTRISKTIPQNRIQVLATRETALHRLFGRVAVQVQTAGGGDAERGSGTDRLWLAPLIRSGRAAALVRRVLPGIDLEGVEWQPLARRAALRLFRRSLIVPLLVGLAASAALGPWGALVGLPLVPWAWLNGRLHAKHAGWALTDRAVLFRSGWWTRRLSVARFSKIQGLRLTESPFDRRHRMASLRVDTAGAGTFGHAIDIALLEAVTARRLLDRLSQEAGTTVFRW